VKGNTADGNNLSSFLHKSLFVLGMDVKDKEEAVHQLADLMYQQGYVKKSFADAVLEREKKFPTGLPTEEINVAIPHTDTEHTIKPAIGVGVLKSPIEFYEIGTNDKKVYPEIIFLLSIVNPEDQVRWLQRLVTLFQTKGFLRKVKDSSSVDACYRLLYDELEALRKEEEEKEKILKS
jgi:galactitol PTS system EIIA component